MASALERNRNRLLIPPHREGRPAPLPFSLFSTTRRDGPWPCQRAAAAFFAISVRFSGERLAALAFPPFNPPRRPRVAAAALIGSSGGASAAPVRLSLSGWREGPLR